MTRWNTLEHAAMTAPANEPEAQEWDLLEKLFDDPAVIKDLNPSQQKVLSFVTAVLNHGRVLLADFVAKLFGGRCRIVIR
jgi:hypothetical protein